MEYKLVSVVGSVGLTATINTLLSSGWQLYGNLTTVKTDNGLQHSQGVVKIPPTPGPTGSGDNFDTIPFGTEKKTG